jgi:hypothetical protein
MATELGVPLSDYATSGLATCPQVTDDALSAAERPDIVQYQGQTIHGPYHTTVKLHYSFVSADLLLTLMSDGYDDHTRLQVIELNRHGITIHYGEQPTSNKKKEKKKKRNVTV